MPVPMNIAYEIDGAANFRGRETSHGLVEQQYLGLGCQCAGDLEPLAPRRPKAACRRVRDLRHADACDHLGRLGAGLVGVSRAQECADHHVLEHGHPLKCQRHLESASETQMRACLGREGCYILAEKPHRTRRRMQVSGQAVEEGRFAGTVRTDQPKDLALADIDGGIVHRLQGTERLGDLAGFKQHRPPSPLPLRL